MLPVLVWLGAAGAATLIADQTLMGGSLTAKAMVAVGYVFTQSGYVVLDFLFNAFPQEWGLDFSVVAPYVAFVDSWLPLNIGFVLFTSYWTIWATVTVTRWVMKCIPFLHLG